MAVIAFNDFLGLFGISNLVAIEIGSWPVIWQLLTLLIIADFIQWNVHRMPHRVPWLWQFHKLHHSVKEMGFAAHMRFHWMEPVVYKSVQYIPLAMIGFGIDDFAGSSFCAYHRASESLQPGLELRTAQVYF